ELSVEDVERAVELLLLPPVKLLPLCLPHLERSGAGRVIAITSAAVLEPTAHLALSNIVRPGVTGWAKTLPRELGPRGISRDDVVCAQSDDAGVGYPIALLASPACAV